MTNGLEHYLDNDAAAGRVMAHARLLLKLAQRFEAIAPGGLGRVAHVANYKSGKIVIHADNGAVAAKIRQMSRRLCGELSLEGAECNDIEVKVQPRQSLYRSTASTVKPISGKAAEILRATAEGMPQGKLRQALDTLLQRALRTE